MDDGDLDAELETAEIEVPVVGFVTEDGVECVRRPTPDDFARHGIEGVVECCMLDQPCIDLEQDLCYDTLVSVCAVEGMSPNCGTNERGEPQCWCDGC